MATKKRVSIILLVLVALAAIPMFSPEFIPFGEGTEGSSPPGGDPFKPDLQGFGVPVPGEEVNLFLMNCLGDQPGYLIMGFWRDNLPAAGGVIYPRMQYVRQIWITALGGDPPVGYWSLVGWEVPANPALIGLSIFAQAITADPGNPNNVTLSNGLEMRIE